ncbi:MAG: tetratricopeptide repeat protein [Pseudarcicella sp.]|nr:tetratricopeptide repeat protein [Pseudarcicella sp.]MBP6411579.1 tetratricopeptide repeat protein [Pseudarcicella sp.]
MEHDFDDNIDEVLQFVEQFEKMLDQGEHVFLDQEAYAQVSEYYINQKEFKKAKKACNLGLSLYPYSNELMLAQAMLLCLEKKFKEALEIIDKSLAFNPNDIDMIYAKANALNASGQYEKAVDLLKECLENPSYNLAEVHFQIAHVHHKSEKFSEAILSYKKAIKLGCFDEEILFSLCGCLEEAERIVEAIPYYEEHINLNPNSFYSWYNLGCTFYKLERMEEAANAFEYTIIIKPDFSTAHFMLGDVYANLGDFQRSEENYNLCLNTDQVSADLYYCLAVSQENQDKFEEAIVNYKESIKLDADCSDAFFGIGVCMYELERSFDAIHYIKKAIELDDTMPIYWLALADAEAFIGNNISANEAYQHTTDNDPACMEAWIKWGNFHYNLEEYNLAASKMITAMEELPQVADFYYRAAIYLIKANNFKDAFFYLETGLILDFDKHEIMYEYFKSVESQKLIFKLVDRFKTEKGI